MNFKKILVISIILMVVSISLGVVVADSAINMGEIKKSDFEIKDVSSKGSFPSPVSSSSVSPKLYDVNFTLDAEIDISKMSDADKKLLTKAVDDKNTSLILNLSGDTKVSVELFKNGEFSISGNTLKVHADTYYTSPDDSQDVELVSIGLRSVDNHYFVAKK